MPPEIVVAEAIGALAGTIVALIFIPPRSVWGFMRRATASIIVGPVTSPVLLWWSRWPETFDSRVAMTAICSFASWWMLGIFYGLINGPIAAWLKKMIVPDKTE